MRRKLFIKLTVRRPTRAVQHELAPIASISIVVDAEAQRCPAHRHASYTSPDPRCCRLSTQRSDRNRRALDRARRTTGNAAIFASANGAEDVLLSGDGTVDGFDDGGASGKFAGAGRFVRGDDIAEEVGAVIVGTAGIAAF